MRINFTHETTRVYERPLPGGGFAAIDLTIVGRPWRPRRYWGELVVERRAQQWRRDGHRPPVVALVVGPAAAAVVDRLMPIAGHNPSLASACLRRESGRKAGR